MNFLDDIINVVKKGKADAVAIALCHLAVTPGKYKVAAG